MLGVFKTQVRSCKRKQASLDPETDTKQKHGHRHMQTNIPCNLNGVICDGAIDKVATRCAVDLHVVNAEKQRMRRFLAVVAAVAET